MWASHGASAPLVLRGHSDAVNAVAVVTAPVMSPPNARHGARTPADLGPPIWRVVSGASDRSLRVWDLESGALLHVLLGHQGAVLSLAALPPDLGVTPAASASAPGLPRVVSGSDDGTLRVWSVLESATEALDVLRGHKGAVNGVSAAPSVAPGAGAAERASPAVRIVSGSSDRTVRVWELATEAERRCGGHSSAVCVLEGHAKKVGAASPRLSPSPYLSVHLPRLHLCVHLLLLPSARSLPPRPSASSPPIDCHWRHHSSPRDYPPREPPPRDHAPRDPPLMITPARLPRSTALQLTPHQPAISSRPPPTAPSPSGASAASGAPPSESRRPPASPCAATSRPLMTARCAW